uniref:Prolipoprotein diacylglyceryl transferase n=1 Tax=Acrobeloides nanus TaxID=290746 RepID=A0A914E8Y0_9BILA
MKGIYEDFVIDSKNIFYELLCGVGVLIGLILCYAFKFVDPRAYLGCFIIAILRQAFVLLVIGRIVLAFIRILSDENHLKYWAQGSPVWYFGLVIKYQITAEELSENRFYTMLVLISFSTIFIFGIIITTIIFKAFQHAKAKASRSKIDAV